MFWDNWFKKDDALEYVTSILFPPVERKVQDGTEFFVDYSIDSNLDAIVLDIQDGTTDENTVKNLQYVIDRLHLIRQRYKIYPEIKNNTTSKFFYMVSANRE